MELVARKVLEDAQACVEELEAVTDPSVFRRRLVEGFALLRMVGHVLRKVDAERSDDSRNYVNSLWESWKNPDTTDAIFREFIEKERNNILKTYEFNFRIDSSPIQFVDGRNVSELENNDLFYVPVLEGRFSSEDVREVMRQACAWWNDQLSKVEERYSIPSDL